MQRLDVQRLKMPTFIYMGKFQSKVQLHKGLFASRGLGVAVLHLVMKCRRQKLTKYTVTWCTGFASMRKTCQTASMLSQDGETRPVLYLIMQG